MPDLTYYFSINKVAILKRFVENGVKADVLISFAHFRERFKSWISYIEQYRKQSGHKLMLDSGAFTNFQRPGTVTLDGYREFLKEHGKLFDEIITLDDIRNKKNTVANFTTLRKDGHKVLIVDDMRDGSEDAPDEFKKFYIDEDKLCLSGWGQTVDKDPASDKLRAAGGIQQRLATRVDRARRKNTNLHLLAVGSLTKFLPHLDKIDSVDSASWGRGPAYGLLFICTAKRIGGIDIPVLKTFDSPQSTAGRRPVPKEFKGLFENFKKRTDSIGGDRVVIELFCIAQIKHYVKELNRIGAEKLSAAFEREKAALGKSRASYFFPITVDDFVLPDVWDISLRLQKAEEDRAASFPEDLELDMDGDEVYIEDEAGLVRVTTERVTKQQVTIEKEKSLTKQVPPQDASTEEKREAQKRRSREFGIEALEGKGERLTFPAGFPKDLRLYGDPVNLMYPLDPPGRARNARARFKQFASDGYEREASKRIVHTRIVERLLALGANPSFDDDDPLDALLPGALKDKLRERESAEKADHRVELLPVEKADEAKNIVFGVVLEPNEVDAQGDTISPDEIERAAHLWLARFQDRGLQHEKLVNSKVEIYESYLAPTNLTVGGQKVKKGTWLLMLHVLDKNLWAEIKGGKFTGFSMGGFARRVRT